MQSDLFSKFLPRCYAISILGFLCCIYNSKGLPLTNQVRTALTRAVRQSKECDTCPSSLFTCDYGGCIEKAKKCDGKKDCRDNSDEANCVDNTNVSRVTSNCKSNQFQCKSGQCISLDDKCSGTPECDDKSDETKETCLNMYCTGFNFKCAYGACVKSFARCNGVKDCVDNSDEEDCSTKVIPKVAQPQDSPEARAPNSGCQLPEHPLNGEWSILGGGKASPKDYVAKNVVLQIECNIGYKLSTENTYLVCKGTEWSTKDIPACLKTCPPIYSTKVTTVRCHDDRGIETKCEEATDGATATVTCAPYYEPVERKNVKRYCWQGTWNRPPPACQPVCGEKRVSATPLIVNGKAVERGNYPWVTAVYHRRGKCFQNVCGGTMLTQRVILTAAHCVTDSQGGSILVDDIRIAVGKYYNKYNDKRDTEAQYSEIEKIITSSFYKADSQHYSSDIALLITKTELLLSKVVQPVCYLDLISINLDRGFVGVVPGFGYTDEDSTTPSETLREIEVPFKSEEECYREFPREWLDKYYTRDKICAGHYKKSIAVCGGDSGGGLVFKNHVDNRYYVHGIVSVGYNLMANKVTSCNIQVSALYTKVADHYAWLDKIVSQYTTVA